MLLRLVNTTRITSSTGASIDGRSNRSWAIRGVGEIGCSMAYGGVWFYTMNSAFYSVPNPQPQTEKPIGSFEGHLSYDFNKLKCWASLDGNFWFGGTTSLNGIPNLALARQARASAGPLRSRRETPVHQDQLQQRNLRSLRWQLSKCFCGLAVFLDWLAEISLPVADL